jgi:toxin ParE1/3/4
MSGYTLSAEAQADLREIQNYIAQDSVTAARAALAVIRESFRDLARTPGLGHVREDLTKRQVRFWLVYSYLIIYRPETKPLEILAVLHGKRNLQEILPNRL